MRKLVVDLTGYRGRMSGIERYGLGVSRELVKHRFVVLLCAKGFSGEVKGVFSGEVDVKESPFGSRVLTELFWLPLLIALMGRQNNYFFPIFPPSPIVYMLTENVFRTVFDAVPWKFSSTTSLKNKLYYRPLERMAILFSRKIFTISESSKKDIEEVFGVDKVINASISIDFNQFCGECGGQAKSIFPERFLLFVGSVEPRKNLLFALDVVEKLWFDGESIPLVVVGRRAWGAKEFEDRLAQLPSNMVVWIDGASDQLLLQAYKASDLLIYPSLYEGFGLPVLESLAMKTPVVAANNSSLSEALGTCGFLVDGFDRSEWAKKVMLLMRQDVRDRFINNIPEHLSGFSWQKTAKTIERSIYG
jgi:glycosyltransferase involved in cell wall biosynthesis